MIRKAKGLLYEDDAVEVFFGNKHFSLTELTSLKPIGVHTVKQTHSDIFHEIRSPEPVHPQPEGDALGTRLSKQYLAIKTADCLPVMIHDPVQNRIAAIHAGWRGVAVKIVPKTIQQFFKISTQLKIYIGPHITKNSFEIKSDVLQQLKATVSTSAWSKITVEEKNDRFYVDLTEVVASQVSSQFPNLSFSLMNTHIDTKTTSDYNSFRRDAANAGRNISYIRLK